jgi:hypothetical protein
MASIKSILKTYFKKSKLAVSVFCYVRKLVARNDVASLQGQIQKNIESQFLYSVKNNVKIFDDIKDAGFRCYSQFEEDGIILYLLTCIGKKTRSVVEIGCGNGSECMSANLIINHGYKGYLFDGDDNNVQAAKNFFKSQKDCLLNQPVIKQAWIKKSNINKLLEDIGLTGEVDVLSLDIDGNDYHIWDSISVIRPRICVFETHCIIPSDLAITIPYTDDFYAMDKGEIDSEFRSASLLAMVKLCRKKGYTMVGSHKHGFNVFFVRDDLLNSLLPRPTIDEIHDNECTRIARQSRWPLVKDHPWVSV